MGSQRYRKIYAETMDRRTFNIVHIKVKTSCCLKCKKRENNKWYHVSWRDKGRNVFPNWKLVSKNKKQWMKNNLSFEQINNKTSINIYW